MQNVFLWLGCAFLVTADHCAKAVAAQPSMLQWQPWCNSPPVASKSGILRESQESAQWGCWPGRCQHFRWWSVADCADKVEVQWLLRSLGKICVCKKFFDAYRMPNNSGCHYSGGCSCPAVRTEWSQTITLYWRAFTMCHQVFLLNLMVPSTKQNWKSSGPLFASTARVCRLKSLVRVIYSLVRASKGPRVRAGFQTHFRLHASYRDCYCFSVTVGWSAAICTFDAVGFLKMLKAFLDDMQWQYHKVQQSFLPTDAWWCVKSSETENLMFTITRSRSYCILFTLIE